MVHDMRTAGVAGVCEWVGDLPACLGIAACYYVFGTLIDYFDWPIAFLISASATLAVALVWTIRTRRWRRPISAYAGRASVRADLSSLLRVVRRRSVIFVTLSYTAFGYFQYLFFYWIEYYFKTIQGQGSGVSRGYSTMITLAMGAGMVCGGWLTDRVPRSLSRRVRMFFVPTIGMFASGGCSRWACCSSPAGHAGCLCDCCRVARHVRSWILDDGCRAGRRVRRNGRRAHEYGR